MSEWKTIPKRYLVYCKGVGIDIGCGDKKFQSSTIGIDISPETDCNIRADGCALPFKTESLDYVFSAHCLEDIPLEEIEGTLVEWFRVLKYRGYLVLCMPHKWGYYPVGHPFANPGHERDWLPEEIISLARKICPHYRIIREMNELFGWSFVIVFEKPYSMDSVRSRKEMYERIWQNS